jgi:hypothetical protein
LRLRADIRRCHGVAATHQVRADQQAHSAYAHGLRSVT